MESPHTDRSRFRPGGIRACPAGLPVKAYAPHCVQVSNIRLRPSPLNRAAPKTGRCRIGDRGMEASPKKKLKWWQWGLIGFFGLALLGAIFPDAKPTEFEKQMAAPKFSAADTEFTLIGRDTYAMVFNRKADPDALPEIARERCRKAQFCQVLGWTDPKFAAGAMPMTDREDDALVFQYSLNRASGHEQTQFNCEVWKRQPAECFAKVD